MPSRTIKLVAPAYLFACLILGGSAQGIWQNMVLEFAGVAIIAWAAMPVDAEPVAAPARRLLLLSLAGVALVALQLIPLPHELWAALGPRGQIADGYRALHIAAPPQPLSVTPAETLNSLLGIIPPLAILCAMVRLRAYQPLWIAIALFAGTLAGILIGALQVASAQPDQSPWYLYADSSFGSAVGFFANVNHMAILLVITLPFLAAVAASARKAGMQRYSAALALCAGAALVVLVGLGLNESLAGYGLALPVIAASVLIILPPNSRLRLWVVVIAALLAVAAVAALETTSIGGSKLGQNATSSVESRKDIMATTSEALHDFLPWGSGLGSFRKVYQLYERPDQVTDTYVVHVHDDYVELALETGVGGVVLMLAFLAWWASAAWRVWRTAEAGPFARAAVIASAAILVHSLVDFPLRTVAIATCFAACLALLADRRGPPVATESDLRPARHIVVG